MRAKQSIKRRAWHIGGNYKRAKKRKQKGGAIPFRLSASLAAPILGEVAKPVFKKIIGRGTTRRRKKRW